MTWANLAGARRGRQRDRRPHREPHQPRHAPDDASRIHQACDDRQALLLHGLHPTSFAYPEGALNQHVKDIVAGLRLQQRPVRRRRDVDRPVYTETVPPPDMFATRTWATPSGGRDHARRPAAGGARGLSHGGGWLQLQGHMVCSQEFFPSDYADCISYFGHMELTR